MHNLIDNPEEWVLPKILLEHAKNRAKDTWLISTEGKQLTYGQAAEHVLRMASFFSSLGIRKGDKIAIMLPNGCQFVTVWLALGTIGAISVLLNTGLEGSFLDHQLQNSEVTAVVLDEQYFGAFFTVASKAAKLKTIISPSEPPSSEKYSFHFVDLNEWSKAECYDGELPINSDISSIIYTSGTTGPAKGVLMPHAHCAYYGVSTVKAMQITPLDRQYCVLPLFHVAGLLVQLGGTLVAGASIVIRPRFSASSWIEDVNTYKATLGHLLGTLAAFVINQPPSDKDKTHQLRAIVNGPVVIAHDEILHERFGIKDVISCYGMTEVNLPVWGAVGKPCPGAIGWIDEQGFDLIVVNPENQQPLPNGEIGEILVRPKIPHCFMAGYINAPDKTVEAWAGLWFHTGDAGFVEDDGLVTFVDRIKDCIRRRGENISATEVDAAVNMIPGIEDVAAFAVPSDIAGGEDEIMLAIVTEQDSTLDLKKIGELVDAALPKFAKPRYLKLVAELPKTLTGKIQRKVLQDQGINGAFDRESGVT